jgi:hypothetical protein
MAKSKAKTGVQDVNYNLVSVIYHALQGAETYDQYIKDAKKDGDQELARFFADIKDQDRLRAERAIILLGQRLTRGQTLAASATSRI